MRYPAAALGFFLAAPLNCLATGTGQGNEIVPLGESSVGTSAYTVVKFEAVCSECTGLSNLRLPLELKVSRPDMACDGSVISLNGQPPIHNRDGDSQHEFGTISVFSGDTPAVLSVSWQGGCAGASCGSAGRCSEMDHFLTVQVEQIDDTDLETSICFSLTLAEGMRPEIHDLRSRPWEITNFDIIDCPDSQLGLVNKASHWILNTLSFSSTIDLFIFGAVAITITSIVLLTFLICRNTIYCRRRRADRAARREERRTRRAYKFAARRLRWRKWWNTFRGTTALLPSANNTQRHEFTAHGFHTS
ncbi:hypothetical protein ASPSYDRAFT_984076 [Aspergillus sydowii CBS 593.65]|uniref:Uncharacterized protein n=1 Tax=Aspergillus sydowii CBS 593.65 TaxID=1036612 RepID=A0A1L9THL2_9EURO|nr:uncharacterized protein ASPSYDRAFT_984076 [Aspergillus sydowii CBS 593.65]OJJ58916.1 hypothetical protein ASPSYDRAFT_984076 [Aspergillus sydowii CBS 593.65]